MRQWFQEMANGSLLAESNFRIFGIATTKTATWMFELKLLILESIIETVSTLHINCQMKDAATKRVVEREYMNWCYHKNIIAELKIVFVAPATCISGMDTPYKNDFVSNWNKTCRSCVQLVYILCDFKNDHSMNNVHCTPSFFMRVLGEGWNYNRLYSHNSSAKAAISI